MTILALYPPTTIAEMAVDSFRFVARANIDAPALPAARRLMAASGAIDAARIRLEPGRFRDPEAHAAHRAVAAAAVEIADEWMRSATTDRAGGAVLEAARRRMHHAVGQLGPQTGSYVPASTLEHLRVARDLVDGVALHTTGATGADVVARATGAAVHASHAARAATLLSGAATLLDAPVAGASISTRANRVAEELVPQRVARATQALEDIASARDELAAFSQPSLANAADGLAHRVLESMTHGHATLRFHEVGRDARRLAADVITEPWIGPVA